MRIVITGATGYLGSHLTRALLDRGDQVVALSRNPEAPGRLKEMAKHLRMRSYCASGMNEACADGPVDAVIHAATCYGRMGEAADALVEANVVRPLGVALAAGARIGRWIDIGTALPPNVSPYALSKSQFAHWLTALPATALAPRFHLQLQHFFGPGDDPRKFTTHVVRQCLDGGRLALTAGTQRRDFLYIDDTVSAILAVLDRAQPTALRTDIPVGSGEAVPVRHFVELVHAVSRSATTLEFGTIPMRPDEPDQCVADTRPLRELGWSASITLAQGVERTLAIERTLHHQHPKHGP